MLIDTHAHINDSDFDKDRASVLAQAQSAGVSLVIDIAEDLASANRALQNALDYPFVYATAGIHPHHADKVSESDIQEIAVLLDHERIVAVGETGLDYYYENAPKQKQRKLFEQLCALACERKMPVVVHSRDAQEDTLSVICEGVKSGLKGVLHCFPGGLDFCKSALEIDFYISFSGIITFKKADALRNIVSQVPEDRILVETDAPYLSPAPFRGKRNEPSFVIKTAQTLAQLRGTPFSQMCDILSDNARRLFKKINIENRP